MPFVEPEHVRFFLMDRTAGENYLLNDIEFTDEEINNALVLAVDKYNSQQPRVDTYTSENFPFRYELLLGASAILMRGKAINMVRNNLDYQTSDGVAVNDRAKKQEYLSIASGFEAEFTDRVTKIKVSKNAESCYGFV